MEIQEKKERKENLAERIHLETTTKPIWLDHICCSRESVRTRDLQRLEEKLINIEEALPAKQNRYQITANTTPDIPQTKHTLTRDLDAHIETWSVS